MPLYLKNYFLASAIVFLALAAFPSVFASSPIKNNTNGGFNQSGNILITDQFNNRVIEIDHAGNIVWQFGNGPHDASANAIAGTNDAERIPGGLTLMSGTGVPPATTTSCKKSGCLDNRVLIVDRGDNIVWQYGQFGVSGFAPNQLNVPVQNTYLPLGLKGTPSVLITDQSNERIIEVQISDHAIIWQYGQNAVSGNGPNQLSNPNAAELLDNGNILISDENNNRAIEVTHTTPSTIVHTYTTAGGLDFSGVAFASRLSNGHTLVTDSNNARVVETDESGTVFWQFFTNARAGSNPTPLPTRAVRLAGGDTLISDQFNDQVIEVTTTASPTIVASYGAIASPGFSPSSAVRLNAPYSAYVIGDYTGLTIP